VTLHVCTAVTRNYLAAAGALAEGLARTNPGARLRVLVVDGERAPLTAPAPPGLEVIGPSALPMDAAEFRRLAALYGAFEICNALKPTVMAQLLDEGAPHAVWIDSDVLVLGDVADLGATAERDGVVLTPHHCLPVPPARHRTDTEMVALTAGTHNAGVVAAAGARGRRMLAWWASRTARECVHDPARGLFVDQRWLDLVPGLFGARVLRDPGINLGWWNAASAPIQDGPGGPAIDGRPIRLLHLSGLDPATPWLLSRHAGPAPAALLSEIPALGALVEEHLDALRRHGQEQRARQPYAYDRFGRGIPLDARMRALYRDELTAWERGDREGEPPGPFDDDGGEGFLDLLRRPLVLDDEEPVIGAYLERIWSEREDLRDAHPDPLGVDAPGIAAWAARDGRAEEGVPAEMLPRRSPAVRRRAPVDGVLLLRMASRRPGADALAAALAEGLAAAGIAYEVVTAEPGRARPRSAVPPEMTETLLVGTPEEIDGLHHLAGHGRRSRSRLVGVLDWTTDPGAAVRDDPALVRLAEVWSPCPAAAGRGVRAVPAPLVPRRADPGAAARTADAPVTFASWLDCEDPAGARDATDALSAYLLAVPRPAGARLEITAVNADRAPGPAEHLRHLARGRPDVAVRGATASPRTWERVAAAGDCYLSLARARGLDLLAAQALAQARPVIACEAPALTSLVSPPGVHLVPGDDDVGNTHRIRRAADLIAEVRRDPVEARRTARLAAGALARGRSAADLGEWLVRVQDERAARQAVAGGV
jgi:hypothetical protein